MIMGWIASLGASVIFGRAKQLLSGPMAGAIVVTTIATVGVLGLSIAFVVMTGAAERRATVAADGRCNARILVANSKVLRDALTRAQVAMDAESKTRAEADIIEARAQRLTEELDAMVRERQAAGPGTAMAVCIPADIVAKINGGKK